MTEAMDAEALLTQSYHQQLENIQTKKPVPTAAMAQPTIPPQQAQLQIPFGAPPPAMQQHQQAPAQRNAANSSSIMMAQQQQKQTVFAPVEEGTQANDYDNRMLDRAGRVQPRAQRRHFAPATNSNSNLMLPTEASVPKASAEKSWFSEEKVRQKVATKKKVAKKPDRPIKHLIHSDSDSDDDDANDLMREGEMQQKSSSLTQENLLNLQHLQVDGTQQRDRAVLTPIKNTRFTVLKNVPIGSGGFGTVYKGFDNQLGDHVAVKESNIGKNNPALEKALRDEYQLLTSLSHPNIVRVYQLTVDGDTGLAQIFMEWMSSGSVYGIMKSTGFRLHENVVRRYTMEALKGLQYLHQQGIVHRDIKPANILVGGGGEIKLSDFGTCKATAQQTAQTTAHVVGTPLYLAPECVAKGKYSKASDIWAMGCSIIEMATGQIPWSELPEEQRQPMPLMFYIGTAQPPNHHPLIPEHLSPPLREIVEKCFEYDMSKRPTAEELLGMSYFKSAMLPDNAESLERFQSELQSLSAASNAGGSSGASSYFSFVNNSASNTTEALRTGQSFVPPIQRQET